MSWCTARIVSGESVNASAAAVPVGEACQRSPRRRSESAASAAKSAASHATWSSRPGPATATSGASSAGTSGPCTSTGAVPDASRRLQSGGCRTDVRKPWPASRERATTPYSHESSSGSGTPARSPARSVSQKSARNATVPASHDRDGRVAYVRMAAHGVTAPKRRSTPLRYSPRTFSPTSRPGASRESRLAPPEVGGDRKRRLGPVRLGARRPGASRARRTAGVPRRGRAALRALDARERARRRAPRRDAARVPRRRRPAARLAGEHDRRVARLGEARPAAVRRRGAAARRLRGGDRALGAPGTAGRGAAPCEPGRVVARAARPTPPAGDGLAGGAAARAARRARGARAAEPDLRGGRGARRVRPGRAARDRARAACARRCGASRRSSAAGPRRSARPTTASTSGSSPKPRGSASTSPGQARAGQRPLPGLRRRLRRCASRTSRATRFYLPPRIAFEPCGERGSRAGWARTPRTARRARRGGAASPRCSARTG